MATIVASPVDRKASERKFYSRMAIFMVVLVFIGFAPSFYLHNVVPAYPRPNPTLPPAVIFHGLMFTLWMALLVIQTQLVSTRRVETHMKLGKAAMLSATILFVAGPAFGRIPLSPPFFWGFTIQLLVGILILFAPMFVWDRRTQGKVHPATWTGFAVALAAAIVPLALIYTNSWAGIARHLPGISG
jgi:hypothetical protein